MKEGDRQYVKHYLIDFGSAFGSDSDMPKNARFGHGYVIPTDKEVTRGIMNLGITPEPWEKAHYPDIPAIGRFEASAFDPEKWVPNYPNRAFDQRTLEDEYWAAKIVMSFTDDDIRAIVETAVPVQREMESGRSPLVSIPPFGRGFSRHRGLSIRLILGRARKGSFRAPVIVSMSPPGYPSAWLHPCRARFRFAWHSHCNSLVHAACCRRSCRCRRASSSLRSRAAWISFCRPASMSAGVTKPIALCRRTVL